MMEKQVMQGVPMMEAPTELRTDEMAELIDEVASFRTPPARWAIRVLLRAQHDSNSNIRMLEVGGVAPDNGTIASGEYPLRRTFYAASAPTRPRTASSESSMTG
jgi:hypothetical protein